MGVVRARTHKAIVLPREYGPVNWYNAPLDLDGKPFRFPWQTEISQKLIIASLSASSSSRPNYTFKFIQIPNRYCTGKSPWATPARTLSPVARNTWITSYNIWISHVFISGLKWLPRCGNAMCSALWPPCSMSLPGIHKER